MSAVAATQRSAQRATLARTAAARGKTRFWTSGRRCRRCRPETAMRHEFRYAARAVFLFFSSIYNCRDLTRFSRSWPKQARSAANQTSSCCCSGSLVPLVLTSAPWGCRRQGSPSGPWGCLMQGSPSAPWGCRRFGGHRHLGPHVLLQPQPWRFDVCSWPWAKLG